MQYNKRRQKEKKKNGRAEQHWKQTPSDRVVKKNFVESLWVLFQIISARSIA
jgi:hypothetical protein